MLGFVSYVSAYLWLLSSQVLCLCTARPCLLSLCHIYCGSNLPVLRLYLLFVSYKTRRDVSNTSFKLVSRAASCVPAYLWHNEPLNHTRVTHHTFVAGHVKRTCISVDALFVDAFIHAAHRLLVD